MVWGKDRFSAIIDWNDAVVKYGLDHRIKYTRLVKRKASSPKARGADCQGYRYCVQLALEGTPSFPVRVRRDLCPCARNLPPMRVKRDD